MFYSFKLIKDDLISAINITNSNLNP